MIREAIDQVRTSFNNQLAAYRRRAALAHAYRGTYDNTDGRMVLLDIMREAGLLQVAQDPADSRFYDGKRAIALHICNRLRWSEAEIVLLAEETTRDDLNEMSAVQ